MKPIIPLDRDLASVRAELRDCLLIANNRQLPLDQRLAAARRANACKVNLLARGQRLKDHA